MTAKALTLREMDLSQLAEAANSGMENCTSFFRSGLTHALRAGQALVEARSRVEDGKWQAWLKDNWEGSEGLARRYMRVAKAPELMEAPDAPETLSEALRILSDSQKKQKRWNYGDSQDAATARLAVPADDEIPQPEPAAEPVFDAEGHLVPIGCPAAVEAFAESRPLCEKIQGELKYLREMMRIYFSDHPAARKMAAQQKETWAWLANIAAAIRWRAPYSVCPYCRAEPGLILQCDACRGDGYVTEEMWKQAPSDLKETMRGPEEDTGIQEGGAVDEGGDGRGAGREDQETTGVEPSLDAAAPDGRPRGGRPRQA